ncbi:MAG: response regulator [Desulfobulbaceae bacterium]|nr:response regulator [Desulfobulbaceae bacterium]
MTTENEEIGKKILIVDDNQDNRELVVKILKRHGYVTCEAADGEEALIKAASERPDLILMDIALPKMDGLEATRRLCQMAEMKETPIIALTAHAMKGDREKALAAGCRDYIAKPINVRDLPEQIARNLN